MTYLVERIRQINSFRDLIVYQKAYKLAMEIFEISKFFHKEEKYSLTDQIQRRNTLKHLFIS